MRGIAAVLRDAAATGTALDAPIVAKALTAASEGAYTAVPARSRARSSPWHARPPRPPRTPAAAGSGLVETLDAARAQGYDAPGAHAADAGRARRGRSGRRRGRRTAAAHRPRGCPISTAVPCPIRPRPRPTPLPSRPPARRIRRGVLHRRSALRGDVPARRPRPVRGRIQGGWTEIGDSIVVVAAMACGTATYTPTTSARPSRPGSRLAGRTASRSPTCSSRPPSTPSPSPTPTSGRRSARPGGDQRGRAVRGGGGGRRGGRRGHPHLYGRRPGGDRRPVDEPVHRGTGRGRSTRCPAGQVVLLPNNKNIVPVAEQVDGETDRTVTWCPPSASSRASLACSPSPAAATAEQNRQAMSEASSAVTAAEVTQAVRTPPLQSAPSEPGTGSASAPMESPR